MRHVKERNEIIAERIKAIRTSRHLTQEDFAEKIGVTPNSISRIERKETALSANVALSISDNFYVSMDYLFGRTLNEEGETACDDCADVQNLQIQLGFQTTIIKELQEKISKMKEILEK